MEAGFALAPASLLRKTASSQDGKRARAVTCTCSVESDHAHLTRRQFGLGLVAAGAVGSVLATPQPSAARVVDPPTSPYKLPANADRTKLATFLPQINDGYNVVLDLERTWDERTSAMDGDVVRRLIGTVGVKSPLFNIGKAITGAMNVVLTRPNVTDESIEDLQESAGGIIDAISTIDFQLYSVNYTELEPTKIKLISQGREALDDLKANYETFLSNLPQE